MALDDPLLSLAAVLLCGIVGGELAGRIRLPKVTGWIGTGIALRAVGVPGLEPSSLGSFSPFTNFVLGYIAFTVGAALHFPSLRNARQRLALLLVGEALLTPAIVTVALTAFGGLALEPALLLAAVAIAGAPGTTVLVVQEARARGILTRTLIAAVALIDMVAVGFFTVSAAWARGGMDGGASMATALGSVGAELGTALLVGATCAVLALVLTRTIVGPAFVGATMVTVILGAWGAGQALGASSILACTFAGITVSNLRHATVRSTEAYLNAFGGVLFAGFYTMAGMRLDFSVVIPAAGLVGWFFLARLVGKWLGAYAAMSLAGVTDRVRRYLGLALLPHGGVAIGLLFIVQEDPRLAGVADTVVAVGLAALAINQLLGPSATRFALQATGEAGMDRPRLLDFLNEQRIVVGLGSASKREVIELLADRLYATTDLPVDRDAFVAQVLEREADESTCLGEGFMIPHGLLPTGSDIRGVLGLSAKGLDLPTPDGRPVHAVVLLATPDSERQRHLEILAAFAGAITRNGNLREQLYHARSAAHAYEVIHAEDAEDLNYFLDEALERAGVGTGD